jgi:hypothetical protein
MKFLKPNKLKKIINILKNQEKDNIREMRIDSFFPKSFVNSPNIVIGLVNNLFTSDKAQKILQKKIKETVQTSNMMALLLNDKALMKDALQRGYIKYSQIPNNHQFKKDKYLLQYCSPTIKEWMKLISSDISFIESLPRDSWHNQKLVDFLFANKETALLALNVNGCFYTCISQDHKLKIDTDIMRAAIVRDAYYTYSIPMEFRENSQKALWLVKQNPRAYWYLPDKTQIDQNVIAEILKNSPELLNYFPTKTNEQCNILNDLLKNNPYLIKHLTNLQKLDLQEYHKNDLETCR